MYGERVGVYFAEINAVYRKEVSVNIEDRSQCADFAIALKNLRFIDMVDVAKVQNAVWGMRWR